MTRKGDLGLAEALEALTNEGSEDEGEGEDGYGYVLDG